MWETRCKTKFWGASNLAQVAGIAALSQQGQRECHEIIEYYLENAFLLKESLKRCGLKCFGGTDNPYVWIKCPQKLTSWNFFENILEKTGIVGMPGNFFGSCGEDYLRLSALGDREEIKEGLDNLTELDLI